MIAPDVGGGFGLKCVAGREEVTLAGIALRLRRPVRWVEDRQENLTASFHGHEQRYQVRAAFGQDGQILGWPPTSSATWARTPRSRSPARSSR